MVVVCVVFAGCVGAELSCDKMSFTWDCVSGVQGDVSGLEAAAAGLLPWFHHFA